MSLFSVENASFRLKESKKQILKNISFEVQEGEILGILGQNGAGKTTLIKCLLEILKWDSGSNKLQGKNLKSCKNKWQVISYVPQAKNSNFNIKVIDMVVLGASPFIYLMPKKEHYLKARKILEELKIDNLSSKSCLELSGGELSMVLFARALINSPKLLILDEPESNLCFKNQKIILEMLKHLSKNGCSIIFNTHFPAHARYLCHKVLMIFKDEKNYLFGDASKMLNANNLSNLYGVPVDFCSYKKEDEYILKL